MGLINYLGESKVIKKICELLKVTDVKVDGTSVVDDNGVANIPSGGTDVDWNQILANGTKIAEITIDEDEPIEVYAPTPTEVVANPTGTATADLTKLKVGNQILNVPDTKQFADLTDVEIDAATLADGQVPKWNSTTHKWENGEGGGSGGHTILDDSDTSLAQEDNLQFKGVYSHDDSTNGKTVVEVARKMTRYQFEQLSNEEKKGLIQIEDEVENDLMIVNGCFIDTRNVIQASTPITSSANVSYTATEDCIVEFTLIAAQNNSSWANIDGKNIWENYCSSGVSQFTNIAHLKKGQVIIFHQTYSQGNGHYIVYGIQQGTDWHSPDYSTTEHKIGRKWIDGKDIYEQTFELVGDPDISVSNNSWGAVSATIPNVSHFIKGDIIAYDGTYQGPVMVWNDSGTIKIQTPRNGVAYARYLTVQYTKTS